MTRSREALQQLSEWNGLLAQNVPIVRQILRKVLEGQLVFVPRHEGDEHWYEFSGEGSLTKFFGGVEPLSMRWCPHGDPVAFIRCEGWLELPYRAVLQRIPPSARKQLQVIYAEERMERSVEVLAMILFGILGL